MYPPEMRKLIQIVEDTRRERARAPAPRRLTLEEREQLVRAWHPDYKPEYKRAVRIGPCKGLVMYSAIADLLESWPLVKPGELDLEHVDYDVDFLVVGSGGAGLAAAWWAVKSGVDPSSVLIATKLRLGDSNTVKYQSGTQAATGPDDSPVIHFLDTLAGAHFTNNPKLVRVLAEEAPLVIKWLEELGVRWSRVGDDLERLPGGGATRARLHCCGDYTGLEVMRVLKDEIRSLGVRVLEFHPVIELLTDPDTGAVSGAVLLNLDTGEYKIVRSKVTVLATGGLGRLHIAGFPTTNHYGATADGLVLAYRVGAGLVDMDTLQYHPTGVAWPEAILGELIPEKTRSIGGQLVNAMGQRFIYELEPRDVVASAIIRECSEGRGVVTPTGTCGVWLDTPIIEMIKGPGTIKRELPALYRMFLRHGIDITEEPILTYPTLHYQNGGVLIDEWTHVLRPSGEPIRGLLAAGEVTGGIHGKNRLVGNSTADIFVFGRRAGIEASKLVRELPKPKLSLRHLERYIEELKQIGVPESRRAPILLPDYRGEAVLKRIIRISFQLK
ncbi:MAG: FAD-binding protein [Desulfurococcaceae archaeon]|nr:FAD-binding protein [Desulfurococcaceae archaeon]